LDKLILIPKPQKLQLLEESIFYNGASFHADRKEIYKYTADFKSGDTKVVFKQDSTLTSEAYRLHVNQEGITIAYGTLEGAFRAVSTFSQLVDQVKEDRMPCLEMEDSPAIPRRGYLLDISRGKIPTLKTLKKFADMLSALKYNEFHLYINRFGYQFKNFARYWKDGNALTPEEIKELDTYCKERFVKLVPNLNSFGHMEAFTEKEEFKHLAISDAKGNPSHTLNPSLKESLELVDSVFDGLFDSFSADTVHIGMDETFYVGQGETEEICKQYGVGRVYTDFLNKVLKLVVDKYHKKPMFWADIVFKHPEELNNIPGYSVVMDWNYESEYNWENHCRLLLEKGLSYYVCPGTSMWSSFTGRHNNAFFNMHSAAVSARDYQAEGYLLTEWGDGGYPQHYSTSYLPIVFGGAVAWNPDRHVCAFRSELIHDCKYYLDKYIYQIQGTVSLAEIVFRMGNYYLLEKELFNNMTLCSFYLHNPEYMTEADRMPMKRVISYMEELEKELDEVTADPWIIKAIRNNCQMVILFTKMQRGDAVSKEEVTLLKEDFLRIWNKENKPYIEEKNAFLKYIDAIYQRYSCFPLLNQ